MLWCCVFVGVLFLFGVCVCFVCDVLCGVVCFLFVGACACVCDAVCLCVLCWVIFVCVVLFCLCSTV